VAERDSVEPDTFAAQLNKAADLLVRRLWKKGKTVSRDQARRKLSEILGRKWGKDSDALTAMMIGLNVWSDAVRAAQTNLMAGRSRGGMRKAANRRAIWETWWQRAQRMQGANPALSLAAAAKRIAEQESRESLEPPSWRTVYEALRRHKRETLRSC
jgi:hypothetical protein